MAKNDWDDIVEEKVSEELRHKTMARVRQELNQKKPAFSWQWIWALIPGLAALVFFFNQKEWEKGSDPISPVAKGEGEEDYLTELASLSDKEVDQYDEELIERLDFYQDLDVLEEWDGREES